MHPGTGGRRARQLAQTSRRTQRRARASAPRRAPKSRTTPARKQAACIHLGSPGRCNRLGKQNHWQGLDGRHGHTDLHAHRERKARRPQGGIVATLDAGSNSRHCPSTQSNDRLPAPNCPGAGFRRVRVRLRARRSLTGNSHAHSRIAEPPALDNQVRAFGA